MVALNQCVQIQSGNIRRGDTHRCAVPIEPVEVFAEKADFPIADKQRRENAVTIKKRAFIKRNARLVLRDALPIPQHIPHGIT
jgi:hypothetical protein